MSRLPTKQVLYLSDMALVSTGQRGRHRPVQLGLDEFLLKTLVFELTPERDVRRFDIQSFKNVDVLFSYDVRFPLKRPLEVKHLSALLKKTEKKCIFRTFYRETAQKRKL